MTTQEVLVLVAHYGDYWMTIDQATGVGEQPCLATAIRDGETLATSNPALIATARGEGVSVVPLPDTRVPRSRARAVSSSVCGSRPACGVCR